MNAFEKAIVDYQHKNQLNAQIIIAQDEQLIYQKNIGYADIERQIPFSKKMLFPIASISKQFTAVAILLLVEEGKISLDKPLSVFIDEKHPIWQNDMPKWANDITIHHLLCHISGLKDYTDEVFTEVEKIADTDMLSHIISQIKHAPLLCTPGESWHYSNTGYLLLYLIIEKYSLEKNVSDFFNNRLFKPLNMTSTFIPNIQQDRAYTRQFNQQINFPVRYVSKLDNVEAQPQKLQHLRFQAPIMGGANMVSTAEDLLKWNTALYQGKVLSEQSFNLFTSVHYNGGLTDDTLGGKIQHGYGIFIQGDNLKNKIYEHGGWIEGIRNHLSFSVLNKVTVLILSNLSPDESQSKEEQYKQFYRLAELTQTLQLISLENQ